MTTVSYNTANRRGVTRAYDYTNGQKITTGATSVQSSAIQSDEVLLHATVDCFVKAGTDPTAADAAGNIPLASGEKFHIRISKGDKIAVIQGSGAGVLFVVPVSG